MSKEAVKIEVVLIPTKDYGTVCLYCQETFCKFNEFGDHMKTHQVSVDGKVLYPCPPRHCKRGFKTILEVISHLDFISRLVGFQNEIAVSQTQPQPQPQPQLQLYREVGIQTGAELEEVYPSSDTDASEEQEGASSSASSVHFDCIACDASMEPCEYMDHYKNVHSSDKKDLVSVSDPDSDLYQSDFGL